MEDVGSAEPRFVSTHKNRLDDCRVGAARLSEGAGVDHAHHHDVPYSRNDGDPQPDGVAGHGLLLVRLAVHRGGRGRRVDARRRVEERMLAAVVVVG